MLSAIIVAMINRVITVGYFKLTTQNKGVYNTLTCPYKNTQAVVLTLVITDTTYTHQTAVVSVNESYFRFWNGSCSRKVCTIRETQLRRK